MVMGETRDRQEARDLDAVIAIFGWRERASARGRMISADRADETLARKIRDSSGAQRGRAGRGPAARILPQ